MQNKKKGESLRFTEIEKMGHLSQIVGKSQKISRLMEYLWYNK